MSSLEQLTSPRFRLRHIGFGWEVVDARRAIVLGKTGDFGAAWDAVVALNRLNGGGDNEESDA